jgi:N-acetylmuramoyl-L-alanine amidase
VNLEFTVQIMVAKASVSAAELKKMSKLGKIDKEAEGTEMYRYFSGTYEVLEDANIQLEKAKLAGYTDAFIVTYKDGERITLQEAKKLIR